MTWILAVISSILYRIGGAGKEEIQFANSQYRDIGCPVIVFIALLLMGFTWYLCLFSALLVLGFIRTYHDYTGADNMYLHGLFIGLSMTPLAWCGVAWYAIVAYSLCLALIMGILNTACTRFSIPFSVWIEEFTRGFVIIAFLPILKI